jgi:hypothetical protein
MVKAKLVRCPYGCGRSILSDRLAAHALISAVEHAFRRVIASDFDEAYEYLSALSQANPTLSILQEVS